MDSPALLGTSRSQVPGRRRLAQRLLPGRDCELRRCGSGWRPSAPLRAGKDVHSVPLHVQFHDWTHLDCAVSLKNGAALRKFHRLIEVAGSNQGVAADNVLNLSKRSVSDRFLLSIDHFASTLQRLTTVLNMSFLR